MDVFITVDKQKMRCSNNVRSFVAGTQEFILFNFLLPDEWKELTVYAQFIQNGESYNIYLDSDYKAYLPPEIKAGTCILALKGTKGNTIAITKPLRLDITENPIKDGLSTTGITLTLYEQLVNKVENLFEDDSLIAQTIERILQEYLEDGKFSAMSLGDHSIEIKKLSYDAIATNDEIVKYIGLPNSIYG